MRVEVLVWIKDKIRGRYLGRHMDHLADNIAKLSQGRENWYIGMEGIPLRVAVKASSYSKAVYVSYTCTTHCHYNIIKYFWALIWVANSTAQVSRLSALGRLLK